LRRHVRSWRKLTRAGTTALGPFEVGEPPPAPLPLGRRSETARENNRHDYFDEMADALQRLAMCIETILNPPDKTNVVDLKRAQR
jgi:hypothetical protein